jgi:hypothetical protein
VTEVPEFESRPSTATKYSAPTPVDIITDTSNNPITRNFMPLLPFLFFRSVAIVKLVLEVSSGCLLATTSEDLPHKLSTIFSGFGPIEQSGSKVVALVLDLFFLPHREEFCIVSQACGGDLRGGFRIHGDIEKPRAVRLSVK